MPKCKISGFEYMVKQLEYEVKTLEQTIKLKDEGVNEAKIAELLGIGATEVRATTHGKLKKAKERLKEYQIRMNGGR
jgi:predicted transcriptional regulator